MSALKRKVLPSDQKHAAKHKFVDRESKRATMESKHKSHSSASRAPAINVQGRINLAAYSNLTEIRTLVSMYATQMLDTLERSSAHLFREIRTFNPNLQLTKDRKSTITKHNKEEYLNLLAKAVPHMYVFSKPRSSKSSSTSSSSSSRSSSSSGSSSS